MQQVIAKQGRKAQVVQVDKKVDDAAVRDMLREAKAFLDLQVASKKQAYARTKQVLNN